MQGRFGIMPCRPCFISCTFRRVPHRNAKYWGWDTRQRNMTFRVPSGWDTEWYTENNRPVILTELKTKAAERNIPLPDRLAECLREAKATSTSEYVVCNRDGNPLSYTQFKRLWQYIVTRTTKERHYFRYEDGKRVKHTVNPVLGEKAAHNGRWYIVWILM